MEYYIYSKTREVLCNQHKLNLRVVNKLFSCAKSNAMLQSPMHKDSCITAVIHVRANNSMATKDKAVLKQNYRKLQVYPSLNKAIKQRLSLTHICIHSFTQQSELLPVVKTGTRLRPSVLLDLQTFLSSCFLQLFFTMTPISSDDSLKTVCLHS